MSKLIKIMVFVMLLLLTSVYGLEICYQESANVSTACGGLATGHYNWTTASADAYKFIDEDWGTFLSGGGFWYITYSIPAGTVLNESTYILQATDSGGNPINLTAKSNLSNCYRDDGIFRVRVWSAIIVMNYLKNISCWDGAAWFNLHTQHLGLGFGRIHEEAINWSIDIYNHVYFNSTENNSAIPNATIKIIYPNGYTITNTTNSSGGISFPFRVAGVDILGEYDIIFEGTPGLVSPVTFTETINRTNAPLNKNYSISLANIHINIYNRENKSLVTENVTILVLGYLNDSTIIGQYNFSISSLTPGDYVIQALSDGYGTEQRIITISSQQNMTVDFYLLNLTGVNTGTLFASNIDEFYRIIVDAKDTLMEYNSATSSFIAVSECQSNANGECQFYIELNIKTYILIGEKVIAGYNYTDTTPPEILTVDNEVRQLFLTLSSQDSLLNIYGMQFNASEIYNWTGLNKSRVVVYFSTQDGSTVQICLECENNNVQTYLTCTNASTGLIIGAEQTLNRSQTYFAYVYVLNLDGTRIPLWDYQYPGLISLESVLESQNFARPLILFFWIVLIVGCLYIKNVTIYGILAAILSFVELFMFPSILILAGSVLKFFIGLSFIFIARKRQDSA